MHGDPLSFSYAAHTKTMVMTDEMEKIGTKRVDGADGSVITEQMLMTEQSVKMEQTETIVLTELMEKIMPEYVADLCPTSSRPRMSMTP